MKISNNWFSLHSQGIWFESPEKFSLNTKRFQVSLSANWNHDPPEKILTTHKSKEYCQISGKTLVSTLINSYWNSNISLDAIINGLSYRTTVEMSKEQSASVLKSFKDDAPEIQLISADQIIIPIGGDNYANNNYAHFVFEFLPKIVFALRLYGPKCCFVINSSCKKWTPLVHIVSNFLYDVDAEIVYIDRSKFSSYWCDNPIFIESSTALHRNYFQDFEQLRFINHLFANMFKISSPPKII